MVILKALNVHICCPLTHDNPFSLIRWPTFKQNFVNKVMQAVYRLMLTQSMHLITFLNKWKWCEAINERCQWSIHVAWSINL